MLADYDFATQLAKKEHYGTAMGAPKQGTKVWPGPGGYQFTITVGDDVGPAEWL
jgi:hypothetical protein